MDVASIASATAAGLAAIATVIMAVTAHQQKALVSLQASEQSKSRRLAAAQAMLAEISDERLKWLRPEILANPALPADCQGHDRTNALSVAYAHDRVAWLVYQDILDADVVYEFQGYEFVTLWRKLADVIEAERKQNKHCCEDFKRLAASFATKHST